MAHCATGKREHKGPKGDDGEKGMNYPAGLGEANWKKRRSVIERGKKR